MIMKRGWSRLTDRVMQFCSMEFLFYASPKPQPGEDLK
jgi:hypothetical protein